MIREVNFDGLVSPTHNYAGLAIGNLASTDSGGTISRPREAALQGLKKMQTLMDLGVLQAFLPPQLRPSIPALRNLGFSGSDADVLQTAFDTAPDLFAGCSSASSMWTANAATIAPSEDSGDQKVHFTPANLVSNFHRSIETLETAETLKAIFRSEEHFVHHQPLPATPTFADEGAANHTRLCGVHLFVYGSDSGTSDTKFPARQTRVACEAIARLHQLPESQVLCLQQNPKAIDAGVFHNDVISVGHENVFLYHQLAFAEQDTAISAIKEKCGNNLCLIEIPTAEVSLKKAVKTYLFNSQIVTRPDGEMSLICPQECQNDSKVRQVIEKRIIAAKNPISEVIYLDLKQSMQNGGGPACLRLRIRLNSEEIDQLPEKIFLNPKNMKFLEKWVKSHYPEQLKINDLTCIERYRDNREALNELRRWIGIPQTNWSTSI